MPKIALWLENICDSLLDSGLITIIIISFFFLTKPNSDLTLKHTQLSSYKFLQGRQQMNFMK
jgi:hypothetical protein